MTGGVLSSTGMKDGQKVVFNGEGDQEPGLEPGDIIIVLDQREHPRFTRSPSLSIIIINMILIIINTILNVLPFNVPEED